LGKCEQRAINTLIRTSEPEKLVGLEEQVVLQCPGHRSANDSITMTVNAKVLHQVASANEFAAGDFSAAAKAHMCAMTIAGNGTFGCGQQHSTNPVLLQQVAAAFLKVADAEAEEVRTCRHHLFSIVNYTAVETAHCQVEDLRDRIQHELSMRKVTEGVYILMIIIMRTSHS
jgi:hypothetical protein